MVAGYIPQPLIVSAVLDEAELGTALTVKEPALSKETVPLLQMKLTAQSAEVWVQLEIAVTAVV